MMVGGQLHVNQLSDVTTQFSLWTNHVLLRQPDISAEDNAVLREICEDYCSGVMSRGAAYKHRVNLETMYAVYPNTPALLRYFRTVQDAVKEYVALYGLTPDDLYPEFNTFANVEGYGDWALHHGHYGNQFVVTYYPYVFRGEDEHKRGGLLQFLPNDPMVSTWMLQRENQCLELRPETGSQVVMPAHIRHGTTPLFSRESKKVALVTNVRFSRAAYRGTTTHMREEEILRAQGVA